MICSNLITAYAVHHLWNGEMRVFLSLDHARAYDYAAKWHGVVKTLHEPEDPPSIAPVPKERLDESQTS
jgi:hypothetical protein